MSGLTAALGWNCGCRAVGHDEDNAYTLIACDGHRNMSAASAMIMTFR